jgi:cytochrome bd ubiquinol oxidase subunit II
MDVTILQLVWFILIAVLWTGYLVLEGFDFGVGMLLPFLAKNEKEKRVMINTIGPHWDGNEVWLITAGGATFAAFPEWYATLFSGAYLALFLILVVLIARIVAFEWRGKINSQAWQNGFTNAIVWASWGAAILWGAAFGNLIAGMPLAAVERYDGVSPVQFVGTPLVDVLLAGNGFALFTGVALALIFLVHGALFTALKTTGELRERAQAFAAKSSGVLLVAGAVWALALHFLYGGGLDFSSVKTIASLAIVVVAAVVLVVLWMLARAKAEGKAFIASTVLIAGVVALIFVRLFPNVIPTSLGDAGAPLTIAGAASSTLTLQLMTGVAAIFVPITLAYTAWAYRVFRGRISVEQIPDSLPVTFSNTVSGAK